MMSLIPEELSSSPNQHAGIQQTGAASGPNFESETAADGGTLSNRTKLLSLTNAIQTRYDIELETKVKRRFAKVSIVS